MVAITQILLALSIPFLVPKLCQFRFFGALSQVGTAYLLGIVFALTPLAASTSASEQLFMLSVGIAITLMLLGSNPREWLPYCTNYLFKSILFFIVLFVIGLMVSFWRPDLNGMLSLFAATFIGSAPNMAAVGVGLSLPKDLLLAAQTADIVICGLYFLLIITFKEKLFFLLPSKKATGTENEKTLNETKSQRGHFLWTLLPVAGVLGISVLAAKLFSDQQIGVLISITTLSILTAFFLPAAKLQFTYHYGEKVFLVFCFILGSKLNFSGFAGLGIESVLYGIAYLIGSLVIFMALSRLMKMDREQFLILTSAGIFSPAMIGPMVSMIKRRDLLGPGMAAASLGLALGNLFGIGLSQLFKFLN